MFRKFTSGLALVAAVFVISGCATSGRNYQSDIDSLNSRVSSLQRESSAKDQEISRLQSQLNEHQSALSQAESDKRSISDKLDAALAAQARAEEAASRPNTGSAPDSTLK